MALVVAEMTTVNTWSPFTALIAAAMPAETACKAFVVPLLAIAAMALMDAAMVWRVVRCITPAHAAVAALITTLNA